MNLFIGTGGEAGEGGRITDLLSALALLAYPFTGALITGRRPENLVGALMTALGLSASLSFFVQNYAEWVLVMDPGVLPGGLLASWFEWPIFTAFGALGFIVLLFPEGRLPSRRWRWVAYAMGTGTLLMVVGSLVNDTIGPTEEANPFVPPSLARLEFLFLIGFAVLLAATFLSAAAPIVRWRRSTALVREQLKWFAYATAFFASSVAVLLGANLLGVNLSESAFDVIFVLGLLGLPVAIGIAILRYRLWDIDRLISRTVSYAIVSAVLAAVFASLMILPLSWLGREETPDLMVAAATLIVAALFRPLRRRVQDVVDHRFNRTRYDAALTVAAFTSRLRETTDVDVLESELREVVKATMQPARIRLWVPK